MRALFPPLEKGRAREGIDRASAIGPQRPVNPHPALRADLPPSGGGREGVARCQNVHQPSNRQPLLKG